MLLPCCWVYLSWNWVQCCCIFVVFLLGQLEQALSPLFILRCWWVNCSCNWVSFAALLLGPLNWNWVRCCCVVAGLIGTEIESVVAALLLIVTALLLGQLELKLSPLLIVVAALLLGELELLWLVVASLLLRCCWFNCSWNSLLLLCFCLLLLPNCWVNWSWNRVCCCCVFACCCCLIAGSIGAEIESVVAVLLLVSTVLFLGQLKLKLSPFLLVVAA